MWSPNELLKTEKQRDILSYITLQFFPFKKVPLEHYPKGRGTFPIWRFSMKNKRKKRKNGFLMFLLLGITLLAAVLVVAVRVHHGNEVKQPEMPGVSTPAPADSVSIDLGSGLEITNISRFAGSFIEDGSDDVLSDVCAITVKNNAAATVQYAHITLSIGEGSYEFDLSTLPSGASAQLLELSRQPLPESTDGLTASLSSFAPFDTEPTLCEDAISIDAQDTAITITNVSGSDITGQIYVYYKSAYGDLYIGGITYRTGVSGLAAGESTTLYASHYSTAYSRIMFVTYVQ